MSEAIKERIRRMTKAEKVEEFRTYLRGGVLLNVDVDRVMADQAAVGAPDSALGDALLRIAVLVGTICGRAPMTAPEFAVVLESQKGRLDRGGQPDRLGGIHGPPPFSLRRRGVVRPLG